MLTIYRRHNPKTCTLPVPKGKKAAGRGEKKCRCTIWISGVDDAGNHVRETTKLRDWTKAENLARHWDNTGARPVVEKRITIEEWKTAFLADATAPAGKNLGRETVRKYKQLFKQIDDFAEQEGYKFINQLDLTALTGLRATWKDGPLSASKKLERLRSTLKFALRRKWINENAALDLDSPTIKPKQTQPFTDDEMKRILKAAKNKTRLCFHFGNAGIRITYFGYRNIVSGSHRRRPAPTAANQDGRASEYAFAERRGENIEGFASYQPKALFLDRCVSDHQHYRILASENSRRVQERKDRRRASAQVSGQFCSIPTTTGRIH
jgi:hypothetical protein